MVAQADDDSLLSFLLLHEQIHATPLRVHRPVLSYGLLVANAKLVLIAFSLAVACAAARGASCASAPKRLHQIMGTVREPSAQPLEGLTFQR